MLLSHITTDPDLQLRDNPFSETTVAAIVEEGIDLARFDPLPVIARGKTAVVGGDGHSRFEAIKQLAQAKRLPAEWKCKKGGWQIPVRVVDEADALRLSYVANMSHDPFTDCEQARIFATRMERGETLAAIARSSHVSQGYVAKRLPLNLLCVDIHIAVGQPWGIDADKAMVLAASFERYNIGKQLQQQLWHRVISKGDWTQCSIRLLMQRIGPRLTASKTEDMLFDLPPNVAQTVAEMTAIAKNRREAERSLRRLMRYRDGIADLCPQLFEFLNASGDELLATLKVSQREDSDVLSALL